MKSPVAALFAICLALAASCAQEQTGSLCESDADCDPGDSCSGGQCTQALTEADTITVTPSAQTLSAQAGLAPPSAFVSLTNNAATNHILVIACNGGAQPVRAQMTIAPNTSSTEEVALPVPQAAGSSTFNCTVDSTSGKTTWTTFAITVETGGVIIPADAGVPDAGAADGGTVETDGESNPAGPVGYNGGTVNLLDFTLTGDTRPPACEQTQNYPSAIHAQIIKSMGAMNPQFALDLGDHMYVCNNSLATAQAQMNLYTQGLVGFPAPFFMTMGNHECTNGADCSANLSDANYSAYSTALAQVSQKALPYYAVQIQTRLGRASIVVVADNFYDATAQAWLQSTLADADANSTYTIIAKHFPMTGSRAGPQGTTTMIENHKYSLILTAHNHDYEHSATALGGRTVICGLGGANPANTGFCRVQQQANGNLNFTQYDLNGNPGAAWSITAR